MSDFKIGDEVRVLTPEEFLEKTGKRCAQAIIGINKGKLKVISINEHITYPITCITVDGTPLHIDGSKSIPFKLEELTFALPTLDLKGIYDG